MYLDVPIIAIDLPGHGESSWREDRDYWPWRNAETLAPIIRKLAPHARLVGGLSLGGLTSIDSPVTTQISSANSS